MYAYKELDLNLIRQKELIIKEAMELDIKLPSRDKVMSSCGNDGAPYEVVLLRYLMGKINLLKK